MACVIETYTDELLFTDVGRRSLKVSKATAVRSCIYRAGNGNDPNNVYI